MRECRKYFEFINLVKLMKLLYYSASEFLEVDLTPLIFQNYAGK